MANKQHYFLDYEGLTELLQKIKEYFASIESLTTEKNLRKAADDILRDDINSINASLSESLVNLTNALNDEIENRTNDDATLEGKITSESELREEADEGLHSDILAERTARIEADSDLNDLIANLKGLVDALYSVDPDSSEESGIIVDKVNSLLLALNDEKVDRISEAADIRSEMASDKADLQADIAELSQRISEVEVIDTEMSSISENAVQNKVIKEYIDNNTFVYRFKGSVENYEDLPTENLTRGDIYNVINACSPDDEHHYEGNTNFVWDGTIWFALSSSVDLSNYYDKDYIDDVVEAIHSTHYDKNYIDSLEQSVNDNFYDKEYIDINYYTIDQVDDILGGHMDDFNYLNDKIDNIELEAAPIAEIKVDGDKVIPVNRTVNLYSSIQVCNDLPAEGDIDKLYRVGSKIYKWANDSWSEIGTGSGGGGEGTDPELRAEFEEFKELTTGQIETLSNAMVTDDELEEHLGNITKETIGLDKVLNYSPTEILAPAMEILEDKVDTEDMNDALAEKVSFTDVVDDLVTPETDKPLSANQGIVLDEKIEAVGARITSLGAALVFKGTVASYEELPTVADNGDCYQIFAEDDQDPHHGEVYAKTEDGWTQVVASAQDMSSLVASQADINRIISDYS